MFTNLHAMKKLVLANACNIVDNNLLEATDVEKKKKKKEEEKNSFIKGNCN